MKFFLIQLVFVLTCFTLAGRDFYVSANTGNDNNNGQSLALSFKTLEKAKEIIRNQAAPGMAENIVVNIDNGYYDLNAPLIFTNADSGKNGYKIIYKKLAGSAARPVISCNSKRITDWSEYKPSIQQAEIGYINFNMLYENNIKGIKKSNPEALLDPGDFCISSNMLYYLPRHSPVKEQEVIVSLAESIIEIRGNSSREPAQNLAFEELIFTATDYNQLYTAVPGREKGLFTIENAEKISITGCKILNAGNTGILISKGSRYITVNNNRVDGFGITGISLTGLTTGDPDYKDSLLSYVNHHNVIANNMVTGGWGMSSGGAGINLYQSGDNTIQKNCITRLTGTGIRIYGMKTPANCRNNVVEYNRISGIRADTFTAAGIYAANTGSGNTYTNNAVYNLANFSSGGIAAGIFLDRNTGGSTVNRNLVYDIHDYWNKNRSRPLYLGASGISVTNNIIALNDKHHDIVYNNDENQSGIINLTGNIFYTEYGYYYHYFLERNFISLAYSRNIIYHPKGEYFIYQSSGKSAFTAWQNNYGFDKDSITGKDPKFREPSSGWFQVTDAELAQFADYKEINFSTGPAAGFALYHARDRIEAENGSSFNGTEKRDTYVLCPGNNSAVSYPRIFFTPDIHYANIRLSSNGFDEANLDTTLEIHSGSAAGPLLGSSQLKGTGGLGVYKTFPLEVTAAPGVYDLCLVFQGMAGNIDKTQVDWFEFSAKEDNGMLEQQPPVVEIISPAPDSQVLVGQPVAIEARGLDDDAIIASMELKINGKLKAREATGSLKYSWTENVPGDYVILVEATDKDGNMGSKSITVSVKTSLSPGPEVTIVSPADKAYLRGMQNIDIAVEAKDAKYPVQVVEFYINGIAMFYDFEPPYIYTWPDVQPGEYSIMVNAINQKGYSTYRDISVLVNNNGFVMGHWTFDNYDSSIAMDSSGNNNHGRIVNAYPVAGLSGGALNFTGQGAVYTDLPLLNNLYQFSMAGWIKSRSLKGRIGFWGQDGVVEFGINGDKIIQLWTLEGGILDAPLPFDKPNEWHHIATVGDGGSIRLYVDGLPVKTENFSTVFYGIYESSFNIGGAVFDPAGNGFDGLIDDVYLYSKAITEAEIKWLARRNGNALPTIKILNPPADTQVNGPCDIRINVMAGDKDSGIKQVDYYVDGEYLGTSNKAPYDYDWNGVVPRNYTLKATVVDNEDATASDSIFFSVVLPGDALIGYWNFNENDATKAYDQSINNNHGTILNGSITQGVDGTALQLQGDGAVITKNGLLNNLRAFTLAGWIKPGETGWRTGFWGQDGVVEFGFSDEKTVTVWTLGGSVSELYPFPLDEWHHVAVVGTGASLRLYYDGTLKASNKQKVASYGSSPWTFNIGGAGIFDSAGNYFTGAIDEVYAYRKALSDEEISGLASVNSWKKPKVKITGLTDGMIIYYPFVAVFTAEITNNDCLANTLEFYINHQLVFADTEFPYDFTWSLEEKPANSTFLITAKLATACGFRAEDSITINVASTEELKRQYAAETGIQPDAGGGLANGTLDSTIKGNKTGNKQKIQGINYYPPLTTGKSGNNSRWSITSVKDKERRETIQSGFQTMAGSQDPDYAQNNPDSQDVLPEEIPGTRYNSGNNREKPVKTSLPGVYNSLETDRSNPGVVHPVIRKIGQAGTAIFLLACIIGSILLIVYYRLKNSTRKTHA